MAYENPTPAPKPLWLIADEWMMEARRLQQVVDDLTALADAQSALIDNHLAEIADLREALAHCQSNDYADDIRADCEDGGRGVACDARITAVTLGTDSAGNINRIGVYRNSDNDAMYCWPKPASIRRMVQMCDKWLHYWGYEYGVHLYKRDEVPQLKG